MTNFKGTKGKWAVDIDLETNGYVSIITADGSITCYNGVSEEKGCPTEKAHANALLLSKAPEMLEMLERARLLLGNVGEFEIAKDIENLIKEATEL